MKPGDRVITASGRSGELLTIAAHMPYHYLVRLDDDGQEYWIVRGAIGPLVSKKK